MVFWEFLLWIIYSLSCVCWNSKHVEQLFINFSILLFIPIQYIDSHTRSFVFYSIPIWLIWSCSQVCFCNLSGNTTNLCFRMTLSITAITSWNVQYSLWVCAMWPLFSGHPLMICSFSCHTWLSCDIGCCSFCIIRHSGMFIVICMVLLFTCIPVTSSSSFSLCFFFWRASLLWRDLGQVCLFFDSVVVYSEEGSL